MQSTVKTEPVCTCTKWHGSQAISEFSPTCALSEHRKKASRTIVQQPRIKGMESTLKRMAKSRKK